MSACRPVAPPSAANFQLCLGSVQRCLVAARWPAGLWCLRSPEQTQCPWGSCWSPPPSLPPHCLPLCPSLQLSTVSSTTEGRGDLKCDSTELYFLF